MHIHNDIGDALSSLRGSTSSLTFDVEYLSVAPFFSPHVVDIRVSYSQATTL